MKAAAKTAPQEAVNFTSSQVFKAANTSEREGWEIVIFLEDIGIW
jgi:NADH:ubiquinone oxidoreductase subunit C